MKKESIRIFLLVLISAYFIMFFPQLGTYAYDVIIHSEESFSRNTFIGTVSIEGLTKKEAETKVSDAVDKWKKSQTYTLTFADQSVQIPLDNFFFVVPESVSNAKTGVNNTLYVNMDDKYLTNILIKLVGTDFVKNINQQAVKAELEKQAGLFTRTQTISINDFLRGEAARREVLSSAKTSINDTTSLQTWVIQHPKLTVPAHANFSFVKDTVGKNTVFSNDFLSKVASLLYEASLATDLEIIERSISTELPDGYKPGYEAKVNTDDLDLTWYNPNEYDIIVQFRVESGSTLIAEMNGFVTGKSYKVVERNRITYPYKQIIQSSTDPTSKPQPGKEGYSVQIYRNVYDTAGIKLNSILISKDFYLPVNEVVVKVPVSETTTTETGVLPDITTSQDLTTEIPETTVPSDTKTVESTNGIH